MSEINQLIKDRVVIATSTLYRMNNETDKIRSELTVKTIKKAREKSYKIIIVDSGSPISIIKKFEKHGANVFLENNPTTMGASRRETFKKTYNSKEDIIVWMEPEKHDFIRNIKKCAMPIIDGKSEIVIPKRKSMLSYPKAQQYIEPFANLFWKELTGKDLDMWFGVRIFTRDIAKYFLDYKGEYGDKWDSLFIPIINAISDNKKIISVKIDYNHDPLQTKNEEHSIEFFKKRVEQLNSLLSICDGHWKKSFQ